MLTALQKTFAIVALGSCAFACVGARAGVGDTEAAQRREASPVASGEDGGPVLAVSPSPTPSSSVATPDVTHDAAPLSPAASWTEPADASYGRSLQDQLRAASVSPDASSFTAPRDLPTSPFSGVSLQSCKRPGGPTGSGHAFITVAPTGEVRSVVVDVAPFAGSEVGACIAERFKKVRVPPFTGGDVKIGKSFLIN